jgi:hypothetical protein
MADTIRVLDYYNPADGNLNTIYTPVTGRAAFVTSVFCSYDYDGLSNPRFASLAVVESGGTPGNKHWQMKDISIPKNNTYVFRGPLCIPDGATLRAQVATFAAANMGFVVNGFETTDDLFAILGQLDATANTLTKLYEAPATKAVSVASIVLCNRNATTQTYRLSVRKAADIGSDHRRQYIAYDTQLLANDFAVIQGIGLEAGGSIWYRHNGGIVASAFGLVAL